MRLLILSTLLTFAACRQKRSIGPLPSIGSGLAAIGSFLSPPTLPPHTKYPVYKVHKYTGIQLKPISHDELAALQPVEHVRHEYGYKEAEGHPPKVIDVVPEYYPEQYSSEPYPAADRNTQAALAAIDSIGGFASLLPEGARGRSLDLDKSSEAVEGEAEDRIGLLRRKPLKLKKKGLLALLSLKGGPKGGLGLIGSGGLGFSGGLQNLYNYVSPSDEEQPYEGPYPGHTTVYRAPPPEPTGGFLSGLSFGQEHKGYPLDLPEPSFPEIPELKVVPEAPKLPHFTLPGKYKLPYSTGTYLSIKVPKPHISSPAPAPVYGPPAEEYGPPPAAYGPPAQEYGPPASTYGLPAQEYGPPASTYGLPAQEYGPPAATYGPPAQEYGPPAVAYGLPAQEYGPPAAVYGPPQIVEYTQPPIEYGIPLPEYHTTTSYSYDVYTHGKNNQLPHENFIPSAPAPPVYNAYQGQVTSYQVPVHEYSHSVDTTSLQAGYPESIATATYTNYPPAQGYSYLDNSHSPSERKNSVVAPETNKIAMNRNEENVEEKEITQEDSEEIQKQQQQRQPGLEKEQEVTKN